MRLEGTLQQWVEGNDIRNLSEALMEREDWSKKPEQSSGFLRGSGLLQARVTSCPWLPWELFGPIHPTGTKKNGYQINGDPEAITEAQD